MRPRYHAFSAVMKTGHHRVRNHTAFAPIADMLVPCINEWPLLGSIVVLSGSCHCGAARWTLEGDPGSITVCNCTLCHRYGALWAYDYEGERVRILGETRAYRRIGKDNPALEMLFCPVCAGVVAWRGLRPDEGRTRMAVNVRLAPPEAVAALPIDHFDGFDTFEDMPSSGKVVRDLWS